MGKRTLPVLALMTLAAMGCGRLVIEPNPVGPPDAPPIPPMGTQPDPVPTPTVIGTSSAVPTSRIPPPPSGTGTSVPPAGTTVSTPPPVPLPVVDCTTLSIDAAGTHVSTAHLGSNRATDVGVVVALDGSQIESLARYDGTLYACDGHVQQIDETTGAVTSSDTTCDGIAADGTAFWIASGRGLEHFESTDFAAGATEIFDGIASRRFTVSGHVVIAAYDTQNAQGLVGTDLRTIDLVNDIDETKPLNVFGLRTTGLDIDAAGTLFGAFTTGFYERSGKQYEITTAQGSSNHGIVCD